MLLGRVLPPINGGLHCGDPSEQPAGPPAKRAPAFQRRAPLRRRRGLVLLALDDGRCSRLSTAGSIAAGFRPGGEAGEVSCSRLSTAGSIAAARPPECIPGCLTVLPPFNGGLHCGLAAGDDFREHLPGAPAFQRRAPLRREPDVRDHHRARVLPPFNGGLHCGPDPQPGSRTCPPGAPAFQRRAPLRRRRHRLLRESWLRAAAERDAISDATEI